jgi:hypothetical protein
MRVGGRREGATERAVVHSAAATAPAIAVVIAPTHTTHSLHPLSSEVNGYIPARDAMRICLRYHVSRGDQCASGALLESFGGQVLAALREVGWESLIAPI